MELSYLMYFFISYGVAFIVGYFCSKLSEYKSTSNGVLKVDTNDPDGPYLFLELSEEDLSDILNKKEVRLKVQITTQK